MKYEGHFFVEDEKKRIDELTLLLKVDPYNLQVLVEKIMLQIRNNDLDEASSNINILKKVRIAPRLVAMFKHAVHGNVGISIFYNLFILSDSYQDAELIADSFFSIKDKVEHFFKKKLANIIIEKVSFYVGTSCVINEIDGLYYIIIGSEVGHLEYKSALIHEAVHCIFQSKNNFIDEGLAVYLEYKFTDETTFPVEKKALSASILKLDPVLSLRAFLIAENYFLNDSDDYQFKVTAYLQSYVFIKKIVAMYGEDRLVEICENIASTKNIDDTWNEIFFVSMESTEVSLYGYKIHLNYTLKTISDLIDAYQENTSSGISSLERKIKYSIYAQKNKLEYYKLFIIFLSKKILHLRHSVINKNMLEIKVLELESVINFVRDHFGFCCYLFDAWLYSAKAILASPYQIKSKYIAKAYYFYQKELSIDPYNAVAKKSYEIFLQNMPASMKSISFP